MGYIVFRGGRQAGGVWPLGAEHGGGRPPPDLRGARYNPYPHQVKTAHWPGLLPPGSSSDPRSTRSTLKTPAAAGSQGKELVGDGNHQCWTSAPDAGLARSPRGDDTQQPDKIRRTDDYCTVSVVPKRRPPAVRPQAATRGFVRARMAGGMIAASRFVPAGRKLVKGRSSIGRPLLFEPFPANDKARPQPLQILTPVCKKFTVSAKLPNDAKAATAAKQHVAACRSPRRSPRREEDGEVSSRVRRRTELTTPPPGIRTLPSYSDRIPQVCHFVDKLQRANGREHVTPLDAPYGPGDSVPEMLCRLCGAQSHPSVFVRTVIYADMLLVALGKNGSPMPLTQKNAARVLLTCFVIACKVNDDKYMTNAGYARFGGVKLQDLNRMEIVVLTALDWRVEISRQTFLEYDTMLAPLSAAKPASALPNNCYV